MKEINGTVTLAYVEEDNRQRVIFRVFPLCTREGGTFNGGAEDFPDDGSMRVVPDKREQSTFKERMRSINGLCALYLINGDGKELVKVRQNRNYAPEQGEKNKLAIYSDVICEFTDDGCFEVLNMGDDAANALTEKVLLHKNKVLYGPVKREEAAKASEAELRPFGNDCFLLHTIDTPLLNKRQIYWDPEAILNWRQRRNALRHKGRNMDETAEANIEEKAESVEAAAAVEQPTPVAVQAVHEQLEEPEALAQPAAEQRDALPESLPDVPSQAIESDSHAALPIGTRLDILDAKLTFDQQISKLDQTLSISANRLSVEAQAADEVEDEPVEAAVHFSGTPLAPIVKPITKSMSKPESMHHVVERQLIRQSAGETSDSLMAQMTDNPIDNLRACIDYVWQSADMRYQAMEALGDNETFMRDMLQLFRQRGLNTHAAAAAQEQLAEIEAERLSLLMQLENAKNNEKKYREEAVSRLSHKLRTESERLKQEVAALNRTKETLTSSLETMSAAVANQVQDFMGKNIQCLSGASEDRILLSPVIGRHYTVQELAEKLRVHMNDCGYGVNEDDAMSLLIYFSINDAICLRAKTESDAARFAQVLLESLGLQSVSGRIHPNAYVEIVSLLPEDNQRTPTVTVQAIGTESMSLYGHKTIYLLHQDSQLMMSDEALAVCPIINIPTAVRRSFARAEEWEAVKPAALSSFADIRADAHPLQEDARKWFDELKECLAQNEPALPHVMLMDMCRFIEIASRKLRGGFLSAADSAVCHWVIPALLMRRVDTKKLSAAFAGLPKALEMLRV